MVSCTKLFLPNLMKIGTDVFASEICEAVIFVLLIEKNYEVHRRDRFRWHDIVCTQFHEDW
jgi:hypothetical protein